MSANAPAGYDPHAFEPFAVTVDLAVFTVRDSRLHVLLVERGADPYKGTGRCPAASSCPASPPSPPPAESSPRRPD